MSGDATETSGSLPESPPGDRSAFVLGYTGEVGKALVKELAAQNTFSNVVLIGRRQVEHEDKALAKLVNSLSHKTSVIKQSFKFFTEHAACLGFSLS